MVCAAPNCVCKPWFNFVNGKCNADTTTEFGGDIPDDVEMSSSVSRLASIGLVLLSVTLLLQITNK